QTPTMNSLSIISATPPCNKTMPPLFLKTMMQPGSNTRAANSAFRSNHRIRMDDPSGLPWYSSQANVAPKISVTAPNSQRPVFGLTPKLSRPESDASSPKNMPNHTADKPSMKNNHSSDQLIQLKSCRPSLFEPLRMTSVVTRAPSAVIKTP